MNFLTRFQSTNLKKTKQGWNERLIDIDQEDNFHFVLSSTNISNSITLSQDIISAPIGSVVETCPYGISLAAELASRVIKKRRCNSYY